MDKVIERLKSIISSKEGHVFITHKYIINISIGNNVKRKHKEIKIIICKYYYCSFFFLLCTYDTCPNFYFTF